MWPSRRVIPTTPLVDRDSLCRLLLLVASCLNVCTARGRLACGDHEVCVGSWWAMMVLGMLCHAFPDDQLYLRDTQHVTVCIEDRVERPPLQDQGSLPTLG